MFNLLDAERREKRSFSSDVQKEISTNFNSEIEETHVHRQFNLDITKLEDVLEQTIKRLKAQNRMIQKFRETAMNILTTELKSLLDIAKINNNARNATIESNSVIYDKANSYASALLFNQSVKKITVKDRREIRLRSSKLSQILQIFPSSIEVIMRINKLAENYDIERFLKIRRIKKDEMILSTKTKVVRIVASTNAK